MSVVRLSLVIWLIVAGAVAFGLYQVKYEVQRLEEDLQKVRQDIRRDRIALHVLEAEWAYLNRPDRLERLARKHLDMAPVGPQQVAAATALPPRIRAQETERAAAEGPDGMPLPRARPWSLERPRYARASDPEPGRGVQTAAVSAPADAAASAAGRDARRSDDAAAISGLPPRPKSRPEKRPAEGRRIAIGDVLIRVGAAQ
jgi:cell division protein FtsL